MLPKSEESQRFTAPYTGCEQILRLPSPGSAPKSTSPSLETTQEALGALCTQNDRCISTSPFADFRSKGYSRATCNSEIAFFGGELWVQLGRER